MADRKISLYTELRIIEGYNSFLERSRDRFNNNLEDSLSGTGLFEPVNFELNYIDVENHQRSAIMRRSEANPILRSALARVTTISDSMKQMAHSRNRLLPQKKDENLNAKVDTLIDLLGEEYNCYVNYSRSTRLRVFKTEGFLGLDNPLSIFSLYGLIIGIVAGMPLMAVRSSLNIPLEAQAFFGVMLLLQPSIMSICYFPYISKLPWKEANYLDDKIKSLTL